MSSVLSTSPKKSTNSEVVQLSINTSSVCCPHRLKRVPIHRSYNFHCCMQCFDHRFCRWCRHSVVPFISSVVPTLHAANYFVGAADTRPPSVPINPPPPCVHQVARTKIEEKIGEGR